MGTDGEDRTLEILSRLNSNEFLSFYEPRIEGPLGTNRYPDFLVVWRSKGVLAIEVKDYINININKSDQSTLLITTKEGVIYNKENPERTAKKYSENIRNLFEK